MTVQATAAAVEALRPGDAGYDTAARAFFGTGAPAVIVRPRDADEVAAALALAQRDGLAVSVRSGGHGPLGSATNVGGIVIDLARFDRVEVLDPARRLVRVGAGAQWGAVAARLDRFGWALTSGDTRSVGVGGLTLGGGVGWLVRRYGLAIDNLAGARVVTADGRLRTASADEHPELFWSLRGGGGNFGVVLDFDFVAQPVPAVHFGSVTYELDDPTALVRRWRDAMRAAPDELSSTVVLMPPMAGRPAAANVLLCYGGDPRTGEREVDAAVEPLLTLGAVTRATLAEQRYGDVLEDAVHPPGARLVARNALVRDLDDAVIAAVVEAHRRPGPAAISLRSLGGAFGRVPADATAFAHRDAEAMITCGVMLPGAATDADIERALVPWRAVAELATGVYLNFHGSATPRDLAAAYPPATLARLVAIKRAYDPYNVFALNHNINPHA